MIPEWMVVEGKAVLAWAEEELTRNTWPRDDNKELLYLTSISLEGDIPGFQLMIPGPDHHARWMSKNLYILKTWIFHLQAFLSDQVKPQPSQDHLLPRDNLVC